MLVWKLMIQIWTKLDLQNIFCVILFKLLVFKFSLGYNEWLDVSVCHANDVANQFFYTLEQRCANFAGTHPDYINRQKVHRC